MPFYKKETNEILSGENFVYTPNVSLTAETKDDFTYPQDGWYWFDTFDAALNFFAGASVNGTSVTPLQGLLAIDATGMSAAYEAWANDPSRTFAEKAFISRATVWNRDDQTIANAAVALGLTEEQLDGLFALAASL